MGLAKIRDNNKRKDSFIDAAVDYSTLSTKDVEYIRKNVFKEFVEPLSEKMLRKTISI